MFVFVSLAVWGYWAPWVAHKTAALTLIGWDMGEYVKFLGEVRTGELRLLREFFYLPPLCATLIILLTASDYTRCMAMIIRSVMLIGAGILTLAILPFFQPPFSYYLKSLLTAEHRGQALMVAVGGAAIGLFPLWSLLSYIPRRVLIVVLAIIGAFGATWQFRRTIPALNHVYGKPITVGWGIWVMIMGFCGIAIIAVIETVRGYSYVSDDHFQ